MMAAVHTVIISMLEVRGYGMGVWDLILVRDMKGFSGHLRSCDMIHSFMQGRLTKASIWHLSLCLWEVGLDWPCVAI